MLVINQLHSETDNKNSWDSMILQWKKWKNTWKNTDKILQQFVKKKATNKLKIVEVAETENLTKSIKDEVDHFSNNNTNDWKSKDFEKSFFESFDCRFCIESFCHPFHGVFYCFIVNGTSYKTASCSLDIRLSKTKNRWTWIFL